MDGPLLILRKKFFTRYIGLSIIETIFYFYIYISKSLGNSARIFKRKRHCNLKTDCLY